MNFIIVGDPHVKNKNLEQSKKLFEFVEKTAKEHNIKNVILTGDVLDTKEVIRGKSLNLVHDWLAESLLNFIVLVGNHDYFNLECQDHALQVLKELHNVSVVDYPSYLHINEEGEASAYLYDYYVQKDDKSSIALLPYFHDMDKLKGHLDKINKDVLIGHLDVVSFDYGNGYISEGGLQLSDLSKFKKVISGHYHKFQEKENLTYVGTPFSHSFGESNQNKYIALFDSEDYSMRFLSTPFPKHITEEINCDTDSTMEIYKNGDHIRLILNGTSENILKWKTNSTIPEGIKIVERPTDEFMNGIQIDETADNFSKFEEWSTNIKGLDPETTQLGLEILEAVK
jgi:DNA repair exonuclease SbcCD nuclease subunit